MKKSVFYTYEIGPCMCVTKFDVTFLFLNIDVKQWIHLVLKFPALSALLDFKMFENVF